MTEPTSNPAPLAYYDDSREPWLPMIRFMAGVAIVQGMVNAIEVIVEFQFVRFDQDLILWISSGISGIGLTIGGVLVLRGKSTGRNWIQVALLILVGGWLGWTILNWVRLARFIVPRAGFISAAREMSFLMPRMLQRCIAPGMLWMFFRQRSVARALV